MRSLIDSESGAESTGIGHGLTADALEFGMAETVRRFRRACGQVV